MADIDDEAHRLGARQNGVFSRHQLLSHGASRTTLDRRTSSGRWSRITAGVYREAWSPLTPAGAISAAVLADDSLVVSHSSAASLWRFDGAMPLSLPVELTSRSGRKRLGPWVIHRSARLDDSDIRLVEGWPCTTRTRTVIDLAAHTTPERLAAMLDTELAAGRLTIVGLDSAIADVGPRRGVAQLRSLLADRRTSRPAESELERLFLAALRREGLPDPVGQFAAPWLAPGERVDFAFVAERVVVELDGHAWHSDRRAFENDRRRDQLAAAAGWRTVRITWRQLVDDSPGVVSLLRTVLAQRVAA